jgi:hypothetical protein
MRQCGEQSRGVRAGCHERFFHQSPGEKKVLFGSIFSLAPTLILCTALYSTVPTLLQKTASDFAAAVVAAMSAI